MSTLKHIEGRIVVSVDHESKNSHKFSDGTVIRLERDYNNLNRRETQPTNAVVISGANIPKGSEILIHHNAPSDTNRIHNYSKLSGKETGSDIKHYSIPEEQCFLWRDENNVWQPIFPYQTALRVFRPYKGVLEGISPTCLKNTLYVTSGGLKGKVVSTIEAVDYVIVFQGINGTEEQIIRFRPNGDEKTNREEEAVAILNDITNKVNNGEYLVGITTKDAKPIKELVPDY
jgi:hypothetical protein